MAQKITINLEVRGSREPELYAGIRAIPDVCRETVLRGLLTLAIGTPTHLVAASARSAAELFDTKVSENEPTITKKLTFLAGRKDDELLYAHFSEVPVGRRKQTVRALLMMGLLTQHAPQKVVHQVFEAAPVAPPVREPETRPSQSAKAPDDPIPPRPGTSNAVLVAADAENEDADSDLQELLGVAQMKV